jgi:acetyl-CoA C-acetyltransferase
MSNVFVINALRTPFGSFAGTLSDVPAPKLASCVIKELLGSSGLDGDAVDQVIAGQVLSGGAGQAPARQAMREAGVPDTAHAMTINKVCGSGLKSMMLAADAIRLGDADVVVAGGMENMSMAPYALPAARSGMRMGDGKAVDLMVFDALTDPYSGRHMGQIAEDRVKAHNFTREELDEYTKESYTRAQNAIEGGLFDEEIVSVVRSTRKGDVIVSKDEEPYQVNFDKLSGLRPVFAKDGAITAANASTINDGASFALLVSDSAVEKYNLKPIARLVSYASASGHPDLFTDMPVLAMQRALDNAQLKAEDIGRFEINEAFASVPMIAIKELGLDRSKVNVNGGAVSIGHPVGASGARLIATLLPELQRSGERYGLASLCIGGGEAVAAIFERLLPDCK